MTSSRPYLIRAMYEWIVDNEMTPHILVDADGEGVLVPREYVENGKIVLNVGPIAVQGLILGNDEVTFSARFSGNSVRMQVPVISVLAVYARENGKGMMFGEDGNEPPPSQGPEPDTPPRPHLKVVK